MNLTSDSPLRFALVGCGTIASTHAAEIARIPSAHLTHCADIVPERAAALAAKHNAVPISLPDLLRDDSVDAVSVCTPSALHAEVGEACLRAGKHVIVEKPMDVSTAACDRLLAAEKQSGKTLAVISQHRFDSASQSVHEAVVLGKLGRVFAADVRVAWYRTQEYYDSGDWRGTWSLDGGGCLMNQGVHTVDLMLWICGPVRAVHAVARTAAHTGIEVEDIICGTLVFESGVIGSLLASTAAYPGFPARLAVYGTNGTAIIEADALKKLEVKGSDAVEAESAAGHALQVASGGTRAALADEEGREWAWGDAHRAQLEDFIQCCRTGERPMVDGSDGRRAVETITALYESARTGQPVTLGGGR